jgi:hypothetical protein
MEKSYRRNEAASIEAVGHGDIPETAGLPGVRNFCNLLAFNSESFFT